MVSRVSSPLRCPRFIFCSLHTFLSQETLPLLNMFGSRNRNNLSNAALKVLISEVLGQKNWQILSEPCAVSGRHPDRPWQCCLLSPFAKENKLRNSKFYLKTLKTTRDGLMKTKDIYVIANTCFLLFEAQGAMV